LELGKFSRYLLDRFFSFHNVLLTFLMPEVTEDVGLTIDDGASLLQFQSAVIFRGDSLQSFEDLEDRAEFLNGRLPICV
jgi:hypothetical protein